VDRDVALLRFAELVAADGELFLPGWQHLVLVSVMEAGTPDMTGFCYLDDGRAVPVSPSDFEILDAVELLRDAMAAQDAGAGWVSAQFRVDRAGDLRAEYEYHDSARWVVTPANVRARAEQFRPAPGGRAT